MGALQSGRASLETLVSDPSSFSALTSRLWNFTTEIHVNDMMGDVTVSNNNVVAGSCFITDFRYRGRLDAFMLRTRQNIRSDNAELYILTLPQIGGNAISQNGRTEFIDNCHLILTSAGTPYRMAAIFDQSQEHNSLHILFPASAARRICPNVDDLLCKAFPVRRGKARLARDIIASLANEAPFLSSQASEELAMMAIQAIIESIACEDEPTEEAGGSPRPVFAELLMSYIKQHRSDPDLSIPKIARAMGISVSHAHNILRSCSTTFHKNVWDERLEGAHRLLSDSRFADRTIASIAYGEGFKSNAHFTRAFQRRYGILPSEVRRSASRANRSLLD